LFVILSEILHKIYNEENIYEEKHKETFCEELVKIENLKPKPERFNVSEKLLFTRSFKGKLLWEKKFEYF
jgi:hypothetical protein